jgi:hypothetical protein
MKNVICNSIVTVSEGESYAVALEFDNCKKGENKSFKDLIPLTILW